VNKESNVACLGGPLSYVREQSPWAIRELVRVARKGAALILGCDSKHGFVRWLLRVHSEGHLQGEDRLDKAIAVYEACEYEAGEGACAHLYTATELTKLLEEAGCDVLELASTPTLMDSWDQSTPGSVRGQSGNCPSYRDGGSRFMSRSEPRALARYRCLQIRAGGK